MLAPPTAQLALVPPARVRGSAAPRALTSPQVRDGWSALTGSVAVAAGAFCLTVGFVGVVGATLTAFALAVGSLAAPRSGIVRHGLDRAAARRVHATRERARRRMLGLASRARHQAYDELRSLVETIERSDPLEAQRFALQDLLDHFVELSAGHHRGSEALRVSSGGSLSATSTSAMPGPSVDPYGIGVRRLRHRLACIARLDQMAGELAATDELIRLIAQRSACAHVVPSTDLEIDRRLVELDAIDETL